jgi:hypothetical protein
MNIYSLGLFFFSSQLLGIVISPPSLLKLGSEHSLCLLTVYDFYLMTRRQASIPFHDALFMFPILTPTSIIVGLFQFQFLSVPVPTCMGLGARIPFDIFDDHVLFRDFPMITTFFFCLVLTCIHTPQSFNLRLGSMALDYLKPHKNEAIVRIRNNGLVILSIIFLTSILPLPSLLASFQVVSSRGAGAETSRAWWYLCATGA